MKTARFVLPRRRSAPHFILCECSFGTHKERLLPSLILFDEQGEYTLEAKDIFAGRRDAAGIQEP